jgi:hypothetical protein
VEEEDERESEDDEQGKPSAIEEGGRHGTKREVEEGRAATLGRSGVRGTYMMIIDRRPLYDNVQAPCETHL